MGKGSWEELEGDRNHMSHHVGVLGRTEDWRSGPGVAGFICVCQGGSSGIPQRLKGNRKFVLLSFLSRVPILSGEPMSTSISC